MHLFIYLHAYLFTYLLILDTGSCYVGLEGILVIPLAQLPKSGATIPLNT